MPASCGRWCDFTATIRDDWHACYAYLKANFGYDRYPGVVHIIPNAGVMVMALLYGDGDFSRTIQIANMAGWDTDCNVGNVGAIMGVAVGWTGIDCALARADERPADRRQPDRHAQHPDHPAVRRSVLPLGAPDGRAGPRRLRPRYHFRYRGST